jgi:drug/metabolite transporter (DMT)-like permease
MLAFFKGLSMTSPINASVIMVTSPIIVLVLSAIILKEKITLIKVLGILIGLTGAVILIIYGQSIVPGDRPFYGNLLILVNATSYGLYLIIVKKLTKKYDSITLIKWLYLFGLILVIPFGFSEVQEIQWQYIPTNIYFNIGFVILFTTFFAYLFNLYALTQLKPTTLSAFIYLQPLIASAYALLLQKDDLNAVKIVAAILIFTGVYLVTKSNSNPSSKNVKL